MTALRDLDKGGVDAVLMDEVVKILYSKEAKGCWVDDFSSREYGIGFRKADVLKESPRNSRKYG